MPTQVQFRRGTTAQNQNFTGASGEISIDTSKKTLVVHDGTTPGGHPLAPNTAFDVANAAFASANNVAPQVAPSFDTANAAFGKANAANVLAYNTGIGANAYADVVGTSANNYAGVMANAANAYALSLTPDLSPAFNVANAAFGSANTVGGYANTVGGYANQAGVIANAAFGAANQAGTVANNANTYAGSTFLKLTAAEQTITGNVSITGNLTLLGGSTTITSNTLSIGDSLIYLAANNYSGTDLVDIGFIANYGNATGANVHTGLYREHVDKEYYLFQGYDAEPVNNHIGALSNNMTLSVLNADLRTSNLNLGGANAIVWIKSAYDATNTKVSSVTGTAGQIFVAGTTTPTLNLITTGVTATTYGGSTNIPVLAVDAYGRVTSASNVAVNGMDYAYANTIWGVANGKVATVSSNSTSRIWANTVTVDTTKTVYVDLATSGVTATNYGGATQIPVLSIDAYGRVTSASNVAVSGMDYAYVNTSAGAANTYAASVGTSTNNYTSATYATKASPTFTGTVTTNANVSNQTLTDGATINWDVSSGAVATVTLGGNRTFAAPTNLKVGTYLLHVIQDGTGSRSITWNAVFKWPAAVAPTLTTTANRRDIISFVSDGTNLYGSFLPDVR